VKLVIAIVRPQKANDVLEALYRAEVRGLPISRVQGHGRRAGRYRRHRLDARRGGARLADDTCARPLYAGLVRSKNTLNTFMLLRLIGVFAPLPVSERDDGLGLDVTRHGEEAYAHGDGMVLLSPEAGLELERPLAQP